MNANKLSILIDTARSPNKGITNIAPKKLIGMPSITQKAMRILKNKVNIKKTNAAPINKLENIISSLADK